ncbi:hypothetical protein EG328_008828 [Venturia inaequalis]|uniref:Uncharacterized protein n=1 Tax=Venturia inaequalis TaxID=5025 RepID=A0A8H3VM47_VENIN|nr:hypothetical protein EG328_008828 [Venturia inaequalis]KAE9991370.1 hypothetical protein EG327_011746 [Venturia inaequalis]
MTSFLDFPREIRQKILTETYKPQTAVSTSYVNHLSYLSRKAWRRELMAESRNVENWVKKKQRMEKWYLILVKVDPTVRDDMELVVEGWYEELSVVFQNLGLMTLGLRAAPSTVHVARRPG